MGVPVRRSRQRNRPASGCQEALHQGGGQGAGAFPVRPRFLTECHGDGGQGVFGDDEEGVEAGVLDDEAVRRAGADVGAGVDIGVAVGVGVAALAVVGGQPYVAAVVEIGGPVGRVAVGEVGAAERGGGRRVDPLQRPVPARAVVHARFPRVQYGREAGAAEVAVRVQIPVPGGQARVDPLKEAAPPGRLGVALVNEPCGEGVHGRLDDPGGLDVRGAPAVAPAVLERQKSGLGK